MTRLKDPMHPGAVLKELYLEPLGLSPIALAHTLEVPRTRIERLVRGDTSMTPDTALRLARAFDTTPGYWMNLQINHDMAIAETTIDVSTIKRLVA